MKKILLALAWFGWLASSVAAQTVVTPGQTGIACAYNSALPTLATGNYGLVQCDSAGRLLLGSTTIITVGGNDAIIQSVPTVANSAHTYTSATNAVAVGSLQTVGVFRTVGTPSGILNYVGVVSKAGPVPAGGLTVYAWNKNPAASTCTDAAQFVHSSTDSPYLIPGFPVTIIPAAAVGSATPLIGAAALLPPIPIKNADTSPSVNIYVCAVGNATFTPAANDFVFNFALIQD